MWQNKYVGIPYKDNGRDEIGIDCWGLVRLVYNKEFGISLPSYAEDYSGSDRQRIAELIAQYREGWQETTQEPKSGDVVLFRVLGLQTHVGIITEYPYFLHARDGRDSSIEKLDASTWSKRVVGIFRYSESAKNNLVAIPNPLQATRITDYIPEGATLHQVHETLQELYGVPGAANINTIIIVNGNVVHKDNWDYKVQSGDVLEYRSLPGKEAARMLAVVALTYFTMGTGPFTLASLTGVGVGTGTFAAGTFATTLVRAGVMAAGTALINKIAPIRPPADTAADAGSARSQNLINSASNSAAPYSTIPVVLGRVRMTPNLGANTYVVPGATDTYLRMLLAWGYGPLNIEDLRIGTNQIGYYECRYQHYFLAGAENTGDLDRLNALYGRDTQQVVRNLPLVGSDASPTPSPWQEVTFTNPAAELQVAIHFPQGLRRIKTKGNGAGDVSAVPFLAEVEFAPVGTSDWRGTIARYNQQTFSFALSGNYATNWSDPESFYYGQTQFFPSTTVYTIFYINGGVWSQQGTTVPSNAIALFNITVTGSSIVAIDRRTEYPHNAPISQSGSLQVVLPTHQFDNLDNRIQIGDQGQAYYKQKDAFTHVQSFSTPDPNVAYKLRIRRISPSNADAADSEFTTLNTALLYTVTAFAPQGSVTVKDPDFGKIARTAIEIRATDQLSGSVEAVNAIVTSVCPDWNGSAWVTRPTNNPASLLRYVLQHPANPQRISDAELSSRVDLAQLQYWHAYCAGKGFAYNNVLGNTRSILDVLRDIAAAGRASPAIVDGKWTVIIDEPKTQVIQHFSTHNSWGFQAVKPLVKIPDAFKVVYVNEAADYIQDEMYVYNKGKSAANAQVFEELQLPGVTNAQAAFRHARWHLAQLALRPETYSLNTDLEYLVCNRGDLVRVQHDVPSWGVGTARVKNTISNTVLELDNDILLESGKSYTVRIRTRTGASITRTLTAITTTGYYTQLTLTSAITPADVLDSLVLVGLLNKESQECLVLSVEPATNGTAKLTLVDYNADMYNIDSSPDYPIPDFNPNITRVQDFVYPTVTQTPTITRVVSDETVLELIGPGVFRTRIGVTYAETPGQAALDKSIVSVELQWKPALSASQTWPGKLVASINTNSFYATDIQEGERYDLRLRYVRWDGVGGPWTTVTNHLAIGRLTPPSSVTNLTVSTLPTSLRLAWNDNPEIDVAYYEVRTTDSGWGSDGYVFRGGATSLQVQPPPSGVSASWFVRAIDTAHNYSATSAAVSFTTPQLDNTTSITGVYSTSSLTEATIELRWAPVSCLFGTAYYELTYAGITKQVLSDSIILPANWLGDRQFTVKVVDQLGNKSSGYSTIITKLPPSSVQNARAQVIDNNVLLYWNFGPKTSLPIAHVLVKRSEAGGTWQTAEVVGTKFGEFTSLSELAGGKYVYWIAAVDTDARESVAVPITAQVAQPPDFKFNAEFVSEFSATKSNAIIENARVLMPVNTTETWTDHFVQNNWAGPSAQVTAGYPVYIQPGLNTGYYEEVFDYGTVLGSSQITLQASGVDVIGTNNIQYVISTSLDGVTYSPVGSLNGFGINFRFVKVRVTVTQNAPGSIYSLTSIRVRLDSKMRTDAGKAEIAQTGSIVNFESEFVDIQSITLTPAGTTPISAVYDFKDEVRAAAYQVVGGVCTVTCTNHGLVAGQQVRLYATSGQATSGIYVIQTAATNSFTVQIPVSNTSGNLSLYPQSMVVYAFTSNTGAPVAATISYQIKGY